MAESSIERSLFVTRRTALRWAGLGIVALGAAACSSDSSAGHGMHGDGMMGTTVPGSVGDGPEIVLESGATFTQPSQVVSKNGRLEVTLEAAAMQVPCASGTRFALAYNGMVPGPTLRARPGDTIVVTLKNRLDTATNLHTHGLHVSPQDNGDNPFVMVEPGDEFVYEFVLPPDHASGTFWYHPHLHGSVASQVAGGLAGAIIVDDDLDALPEMASTVERLLVLSDPKLGGDASVLEVSSQTQMDGREGDLPLVNGQSVPVIEAAAGTVERWRVVNASVSRYYDLRLVAGVMHLIGSDHGRLGAPIEVDHVLLTPGQRAELLIPLDAVGTITLTTTAVRRGMYMAGMESMAGMDGVTGMDGRTLSGAADLLTMNVTGAAAGAPALPPTLRPATAFETTTAGVERAISFGAMGMGAGEFVIDGATFDHERVDWKAPAGTVEDWVITNNSMMPHPFHLHVWPFRVIERSDGSEPDPGWRDTVNIPIGQSVRIRIPFTEQTGRSVYHCHILDHEDLGMMGVVEVA